MTEDNRGLCDCGAIIPQQIQSYQFGPMMIQNRQERCDECAFMAMFRSIGLLPCPYKLPAFRPAKDGRMPQAFMELIQKQRELHQVPHGA